MELSKEIEITPTPFKKPFSDHTYQSIQVDFSDADRKPLFSVSGITWNLLNRCRSQLRDGNGKLTHHANNPWNIEETDEQYLERKKKQIDKIVDELTVGHDFGFLQEIDFLKVNAFLNQKNPSVKAYSWIEKQRELKQYFEDSLKAKGWALLIAPETGEKGHKIQDLGMIYDSSKITPVERTNSKGKLVPQGEGCFLHTKSNIYHGYEWRFRHKVSQEQFALTNYHLDYDEENSQNYAQRIKDYQQDCINEKNMPTVMGGDANHPHDCDISNALGDPKRATNLQMKNEAKPEEGVTHLDDRYKEVSKAYDLFHVSPTKDGYAAAALLESEFFEKAEGMKTYQVEIMVDVDLNSEDGEDGEDGEDEKYAIKKISFVGYYASSVPGQPLSQQDYLSKSDPMKYYFYHKNEFIRLAASKRGKPEFENLCVRAPEVMAFFDNEIYAELDRTEQNNKFSEFGEYFEKANAVLGLNQNAANENENENENENAKIAKTKIKTLLEYTVDTFGKREYGKLLLGSTLAIVSMVVLGLALFALLNTITFGIPAGIAFGLGIGAAVVGGAGFIGNMGFLGKNSTKKIPIKFNLFNKLLNPSNIEYELIKPSKIENEKRVKEIDISTIKDMEVFNGKIESPILLTEKVKKIIEHEDEHKYCLDKGGKWILYFKEVPVEEWEIIKRLLKEGSLFGGQLLPINPESGHSDFKITFDVHDHRDKAAVLHTYETIMAAGLANNAINKGSLEFKKNKESWDSKPFGKNYTDSDIQKLREEAVNQRNDHNVLDFHSSYGSDLNPVL